MKDTKFIKKDPTDMGKLTILGVQNALAQLDTLVKSRKLIDRQTVTLAYSDGKTNNIKRVLNTDLDQLIDAKVAEAVLPIIEELIQDVISELEDAGISLTGASMALLESTDQ